MPLSDVMQQAIIDAMDAGVEMEEFVASYERTWAGVKGRPCPSIESDRVRDYWQHVAIVRDTVRGVPSPDQAEEVNADT